MNKTTQHWRKRLIASDRPAYLTIPDLIAEDLRDGRLTTRDRLPTLRELAGDLHLNDTTVARAYAEARKRGLIDSRAGTGSFVRGRGPALPLRGGTAAEMTMNLPPEPNDAGLLARLHDSASEVMAQADLYAMFRYQDFGGTLANRDAGTSWLRRRLPHASAGRVLVCPGIHAVLLALISQLARPGELICVEALAYPGLKAITSQLGVQMHALALEGDGIDVGAGLRSAYVCAPNERQAQRLAGALRAMCVMASPVTNALVTRWVSDGTAEAMLQAIRAESMARQALALRHLARHHVQAQAEGFHLWLPLASSWSVVEFASYLRTQGVAVVASAAFATDANPPDAVRVCLGGPVSRDECEHALELIADTLDHPLHPHATVM